MFFFFFESRCSFCFFFFFSSRRRHTRSTRDWSSDVCSSDLIGRAEDRAHRSGGERRSRLGGDEIGRASCRERVYISVVAVSLKKKKNKKNRLGCAISGGVQRCGTKLSG